LGTSRWLLGQVGGCWDKSFVPWDKLKGAWDKSTRAWDKCRVGWDKSVADLERLA
jgi:hypothetical protein